MQEPNQESSILEAPAELKYTDATPFKSGNFSSSNERLYTELKLKVWASESGRPVSRAMVSIDSIGRTAVCDHAGTACITALSPGKYLVDIISPGFIAVSTVVIIEGSGSQELKIKMVSNI